MAVEVWDSIKDNQDNYYFVYDWSYYENLYEDPTQEIETFMKRRNH